MNAVVIPIAYQRQPNGTWIPVVPSADGTTIAAPSTAAIIDAAGNSWTIGANGVLAVNGAADLSTYGVSQLAYVGGEIWQWNGTAWCSKAVPVWTAEANSPFSAVLSWSPPTTNADGTPITGLTGYVISYGLSPTAMTNRVTVPAPASSYSFPSLAAGTWYFEIAAVNKFNVASTQSAVVSKIIT